MGVADAVVFVPPGRSGGLPSRGVVVAVLMVVLDAVFVSLVVFAQGTALG